MCLTQVPYSRPNTPNVGHGSETADHAQWALHDLRAMTTADHWSLRVKQNGAYGILKSFSPFNIKRVSFRAIRKRVFISWGIVKQISYRRYKGVKECVVLFSCHVCEKEKGEKNVSMLDGAIFYWVRESESGQELIDGSLYLHWFLEWPFSE